MIRVADDDVYDFAVHWVQWVPMPYVRCLGEDKCHFDGEKIVIYKRQDPLQPFVKSRFSKIDGLCQDKIVRSSSLHKLARKIVKVVVDERIEK